MTLTPSRHYQAAPPPPLPDEDYWNALLNQASEEEREDSSSLEDEEWLPASDGQKNGNGQEGTPHDWELAQTVFDHDQTVTLEVVGYNKGGLLVQWNTLRGFVPASQLVTDLTDPHSQPTRQQITEYVGKCLELRVIELNYPQNRLILSQRAAQVMPGTRASTLQNLTTGSQCKGLVTNVCDFGVFVDLGGIEGLIHISELSWGRVENPAELVRRGQKVDVYVLEVAPDEGRVALSMKRLIPDPWVTAKQRYHVGQKVEAVITTVVNFGAFAALEEGLEGLIHTSELAEGQFLHPRNVVSEGEHILVQILNIDEHARRIGLSLRAMQRG